MSTGQENARYSSRPVPLTDTTASALKAAFIPPRTLLHPHEAIEIRGECPRCHHFVHYMLHLREFAPDSASDTVTSDTGTPRRLVEGHPQAEPPPKYRFALNCNCAEAHESNGKDKVTGCGAWFNVGVDRSGDLGIVRPGSPDLSQYEVQNAQLRDDLASKELQRVRAAAVSWKTGLGALFLLIPTLVVVKGTDTVDGLASTDKIIVGGLIAFGSTLAVVATLIALRAAYGPMRRPKTVSDDNTIPIVSEVGKTVAALQMTRALTIVASAALAASIAYAWAAPRSKPGLSVNLANGSAYCGKLVGVQAGVMQIETADGVTRPIPTADITSATSVSSC